MIISNILNKYIELKKKENYLFIFEFYGHEFKESIKQIHIYTHKYINISKRA